MSADPVSDRRAKAQPTARAASSGLSLDDLAAALGRSIPSAIIDRPQRGGLRLVIAYADLATFEAEHVAHVETIAALGEPRSVASEVSPSDSRRPSGAQSLTVTVR